VKYRLSVRPLWWLEGIWYLGSWLSSAPGNNRQSNQA
jgi:hypothetical protein